MRRIAFALLLAARAAHADDFDPLDADGWPKGLSLEDLRDLPECTAPLPHTPGAPVNCRPAVESGGLQWGLGFDWTTGGVFGTVPTEGGAHALGVEADFAVARAWQLAGRYELGGIGLPTSMGGGSALTQHFFALLKYRLFSDEVGRDAWVLGAGAGFALHPDELGGNAPLARVSLAHELGSFIGESSAVTGALELAFEYSQIGDARLDAVLASVRLGFETNVRTPEGLGRPAPKPAWQRAYSFEVMASAWLGLGVSVEVPASRHLRLVGSGSFLFDITRDDKLHGFEGAQWGALLGPRLQGDLFYLQAQAGGAWVGGDASGGELRAIAQGELGVRGFVGCDGALDLGAWLRDDLATGDAIAGGLMMRVVSGAQPSRGSCGRGLALAMPQPPPAPPPVVATPTYQPEVPEVRVPEVPEVHVQVELPKPEPFVVEVDLGAAIGPFSVRLDPRLLPLARLRGAAFITVELTGPADAMPRLTAELQGTLSRDGIRVDSIVNAGTTDAVLHAKFTVYPPGTHP
jgi:hypothetical protein